ncbi:MAG: sigma-70 family RNA polymerase sigma factor [Bacteroidales bacterium]|nr:sigma-70 family RNA polymerase sigma factor [Bacteroidales bacterium]MCF8457590.1 sigma-70 family RNA polymerase sigma factor [Bacteroidales bacterium]
MRAVCRRYCKNSEDAEDLLQEGFIKVFKNIDQYNWSGSFEGWMRRIFVGNTINYIKSKDYEIFSQHGDIDSFDLCLANDDNHDNELFFKSGQIEIEEEVSVDELIAMLQELPNGCRVIFNLYVIEEYSHKEIAELLHITEGTSKSQLSKARKMLQLHVSRYVAKKKDEKAKRANWYLRVI